MFVTDLWWNWWLKGITICMNQEIVGDYANDDIYEADDDEDDDDDLKDEDEE